MFEAILYKHCQVSDCIISACDFAMMDVYAGDTTKSMHVAAWD